MITPSTPRRRASTRSVGIALVCGVVSWVSLACTQSTQHGHDSTATSNHPPAAPVDRLISTAYESAQRLTHAAEGRQLTSDPQMHTASSDRLMTTHKLGATDELVRPQISITRNRAKAADGTKTNDINQIEVDATALARQGRKLCHVALTFTFTQHSPLASSSDLTVGLAIQGLQDTKNLQVQQVRVEPDLGVSNGSMESSSLSTIVITYDAEAGEFTNSTNHTEAPTTDREFSRAATLIHEVTDCIVKAFDQDKAGQDQDGSSAVNEDQLRKLGVCVATCVVTGRIPFQSPAWGASTLIATLSLDRSNQETHIIVTDSANNIRWRYDNAALNEQLVPAIGTPDKAGNLYILYNPGRYDGIAVLRPVKSGFDNFGTLPSPGDYNARFYGAKIIDTNGDGVFEIQQDANDCNPSCAGGNMTSTIFVWNGTDYAQTK